MKGKHTIFSVNEHQHTVGDIVRRTAFSFFLFAAVLAGLLTLSWYLLVPELTNVEIGGVSRGISELKAYQADLEEEIHLLENRRSAYLLPGQNVLYQNIKDLKAGREDFQILRSELTRVMKEIVPDHTDVIVLLGYYFSAESNIVEVRGDVRNVGPRSMTVLAKFVEEVRGISMVHDVASSRFARVEDDEIGFHSPFVLRITLQ